MPKTTVVPSEWDSFDSYPFFSRSAASQQIVNKKYDIIFSFDELYEAISIISTWTGGASIPAPAAAAQVVLTRSKSENLCNIRAIITI